MNPFPKAVHLPTLKRDLFGSDRLPEDSRFYLFSNRVLRDWRGDKITTAKVKVLRPKEGTHRVQIQCPVCQEWIPAGRVNQHGKVHDEATSPSPILKKVNTVTGFPGENVSCYENYQ